MIKKTHRVSKSTRWIQALARYPVPAIPRVKPRNLIVPILTFSPLGNKEQNA